MEHFLLTWIPLIVSVVALVMSFMRGSKTDRQNDTEDFKKRVEADTKVNMKLDEIGRNVSDIKNDLRGIRKDVQEIDNRVVMVESSVKSLHKRVDTMESRLNFQDDKE